MGEPLSFAMDASPLSSTGRVRMAISMILPKVVSERKPQAATASMRPISPTAAMPRGSSMKGISADQVADVRDEDRQQRHGGDAVSHGQFP